MIARNNAPAQFKPRKDMVITDGQKLTLGDVTATSLSDAGPRSG